MANDIAIFDGELAEAGTGAVVGVAATYSALLELLVRWKVERGLTFEGLERRAGWAAGQASKILSPRHARSLGPKTVGPLLYSMGLEIAIIVRDPPRPDLRHRLSAKPAHPDQPASSIEAQQ